MRPEGPGNLQEHSLLAAFTLQPWPCPQGPGCTADDPLFPRDTSYPDCIPFPLFARPSVSLYISVQPWQAPCARGSDQLYLSDGCRKASAILAQNPRERKQAIFNDCIHGSLHCSCSIGSFLPLSLHSSSTCLSGSQMLFLDAPFTLLYFQQLTLYVLALYLLLK